MPVSHTPFAGSPQPQGRHAGRKGTICDSTVAQYKRMVQRLEKIWREDSGFVSDEETVFSRPIEFCHWFTQSVQKKRWAKSTFWLYKSSLLWHFEKYGPIEALRMVEEIPSKGLAPRGDATSSLKLKRLSGEYLTQLLARLDMPNNRKSKLDKLIGLWIRAGLYTGLRPVEWEHATFNAATGTLTVVNAKYDEVRGNGEVRHLIFDPAKNAREVFSIVSFLSELRERMGKESFRDVYERCRKRLMYVTRRLWPRAREFPSLYSTRHQFAANMKKSGLSKVQVAALMGHRSDATAGTHYARTRVGLIVRPPVSPQSEIDTVIQKQKNWKPVPRDKS